MGVTACIWSAAIPAFAQSASSPDPRSAAFLVNQICVGRAGQPVPPGRLIAAAFAQQGRFIDENAASSAMLQADDTIARNALAALRGMSRYIVANATERRPPVIFSMEGNSQGEAPLIIWLESGGTRGNFVCAPAPASPSTRWRPIGDSASATPALRLRGTIEGLSASASELSTTDAARFSVTRTIERQDDGTDRRTTALTLDAVLGLRLLSADDPQQVILFVGVDRDRIRVSPTPTAGQSDEVNTRSVGVRMHAETDPSITGGLSQRFAGDLTYIHDRTADSEILRVRTSWRPGLVNVEDRRGPCTFGAFTPQSTLQSRCWIEAQAAAADIIEQGTGAFSFTGAYAAAGGLFGFELQLDDADLRGRLGKVEGGPFLRATQLYQIVVGRNLPDIHRIDAALGYRAFVAEGLGLELAATLAYGINADTFASERRMTVTAGVIF
jgi:hypothetical protein